MNNKKRILFSTESTATCTTGFSVIAKEILTRLHATGKYELAELASYASQDDPRLLENPWKTYGAIPSDNNKVAKQRYDSSIHGQFGEAVLEFCCLDYKPSIIIDLRDWWMGKFILNSPFRKYYKYIWLLTLDGSPQVPIWVEDYAKCDLILTYSKYGKRIIEEESGQKVKCFGVTSPGFNHEIFKPLDKNKLREEFGIDKNANIVLTVMRNQIRKLYPQLVKAFKLFIDKAVQENNESVAKNTYLYLHTSFPDVGWNLSSIILNSGIAHKIYVTYLCKACRKFYPDKFQTELTICKHCGNLAGHMPNSTDGIKTEELAQIYNISDLYIQYSLSEGFGVPLAEAKGCGIPVFGIDHTAISEQVSIPGGVPLKIGGTIWEGCTQTGQERFVSNEPETANELYKFFCLPKQEQKELGKLAREDALKTSTFERSAKIFEDAIDSLEIHDPKDTWFNPKGNFAPLRRDMPNFQNSSDLINWSLEHILGKPELIGSIWANDLLKGLNVGYIGHKNNSNQKVRCDANYILNMLAELATEHNFWEQQRLNMLKPKAPSDSIRWSLE